MLKCLSETRQICLIYLTWIWRKTVTCKQKYNPRPTMFVLRLSVGSIISRSNFCKSVQVLVKNNQSGCRSGRISLVTQQVPKQDFKVVILHKVFEIWKRLFTAQLILHNGNAIIVIFSRYDYGFRCLALGEWPCINIKFNKYTKEINS